MKISTQTLTILKNFASINQALLVKKGDVLQTISPQNIIVAESVIDETFPQDFAIYDLNKLINAKNLLDEPEFSFQKNHLKIVSNNRAFTYLYADPSTIHSMREGLKEKLSSVAENSEISFSLSADDFSDILKASSVMEFEHLAVTGDGERINLISKSEKTGGDFIINLDENTNNTFQMVFDINHLKLLPGNYNVRISSQGIGHFKNKDVEVEYWITVQKQLSNFGE